MAIVVGSGIVAACTEAPLASGPTPATDNAGVSRERVSIDQVCAPPEASLIYPGATKLGPLGSEETATSSAYCGAIIATPDDQVAVYHWYTNWLQDHGYQFYLDISGGAMTSTRTFQKLPACRETFMMGPDSPTGLADLGVKTQALPPGTRTVFEFTYSLPRVGEVRGCHPAKPLPPVPSTAAPPVIH